MVWDSYAGYIDPDYCRDTDTYLTPSSERGPLTPAVIVTIFFLGVATLVAYMIMEVLRIHRLRSDSERST